MRASRMLLGSMVAATASAAAAVALPPPPVARVPAWQREQVVVIGHRGAAGHAPENTVESLRRAVELGARTVEFDLRVSADGHVVVMHDDTVDRTTDGSGRVSRHTLEELRRLDAGHGWPAEDGSYPYRGKGLRVPTLEEALEAADGAFRVMELKADAGPGLPERAIETVRRMGCEGSVLMASEDERALRIVRDRLPAVPTNLAEGEARRFYALHLVGLQRRWRGRGRVLQVPEVHEGRVVVTPRFVAAAHDRGLDVQVWTVNDADTMRRLVEYGVDGLVTDYPDRALDVVAAAGLRPRD